MKKRKLRIALVSDFFCPNTGGVETHIYYLGECLLKLGHKIIVITHAYDERQGIRFLSNGLKVYYLPTIVIYNNTTMSSIIGSQYFFRKIFLEEEIEIVHGHSTFSTMTHEALFHAWCMGLCTIFTEHSLFGFASASSILTNKLLLRYSLINIDNIICVSHTSKENTVLRAKICPSKIFVIPNAINAEFFPPDPVQFYTNRTTIVAISRLVYRKGIDLLVNVIPEVCRRHVNVRFLIGGDGPKRVQLEEMREKYQLHSRVFTLGILPHNKVRNVLVQGQIFLNTSLTEAFCISILEAASCGLHVVSTKIGGIPEVLPKNFISLCKPDVKEITNALLDAIYQRESNNFMEPLEKHKYVYNMYKWTDVAKRTEFVYCTSLKNKKNAFKQKLRNFLSAGFWFGIVWATVACINLVIFRIFNFFDRKQNNKSIKFLRNFFITKHFNRPFVKI